MRCISCKIVWKRKLSNCPGCYRVLVDLTNYLSEGGVFYYVPESDTDYWLTWDGHRKASQCL